jgi:hypothetical protein
LLDHDNTSFGYLDAADGGQGSNFKGYFAFTVVPDNDLVLGKLRGTTTAYQGKIVGVTHHLNETETGIENCQET